MNRPPPRDIPQAESCGCGGPELTCMAHRCQRCKRDGTGGVILADTEDWARPLCDECFEAVGEREDWT